MTTSTMPHSELCDLCSYRAPRRHLTVLQDDGFVFECGHFLLDFIGEVIMIHGLQQDPPWRICSGSTARYFTISSIYSLKHLAAPLRNWCRTATRSDGCD